MWVQCVVTMHSTVDILGTGHLLQGGGATKREGGGT